MRQLISGAKLALAESLFYLSFHARFNTTAILDTLKHVAGISLDGAATMSPADATVLFAVANAVSVEIKVDVI